MTGLRSWFERLWLGSAYQTRLWPVLALLSQIYALLLWLDRKRRRVKALPVPLVVVGNLTVGGSGKSILVAALVQELSAIGLRVAIVSRGYGRRGKDLLEVSSSSRAEEVGDEPLMLWQQTAVPVVVASDRVQAVHYLQQRHQPQLVIADDGLQHWSWRPDLGLLLLDPERGLHNDKLLPWGPWRQPVSQIQHFAHRLVKLQPEQVNPWPDSLSMSMVAAKLVPLYADGPALPEAGEALQIVTSVAQPQSVLKLAQSQGLVIQGVSAFADHHLFSPNDLQALQTRSLLVTAKDAVKLKGLVGPRCWVLQPEIQILPQQQWQQLLAQVVDLVNS